MITIGKISGKKAITLPVAPPSYEVTDEQDNQTVNIYGLGEILLKGEKKLRTLTFSSFFPAQKYAFADTNNTQPWNLVNKIREWKDDKETLRVTISNAISLRCVIQSFTYSEEDGTGDVKYTITFQEDRKIKGKRAEKTVTAKKYTCKAGDTFYKVARKTTGSTSNASKIAKANKMKVNSKLKKGQKLVIKI
jgi:LysM repeat protein